ncbi:MAG: carbohydrate ABC transporter permease [Bacillales bacterium]|jgi:putative aldouronate transport system permease protein|nr:carbohydrate ABC transporter permease [Bacillales bacterium]
MVNIYKKDKIFDWVVIIIMGVFSVVLLLPLLHVLASSFSSPEAVNLGKVGLFPVNFSLVSYQKVFANKLIMRGYLNTIIYTVIGTIIQLILQFTAAYALSRKDLKYKRFWNVFFVIPMFIGGGMIPTYLVVKSLGMINTIWAMIIPGCVSLFNIIIIRTYMTSMIPYELQEAAMIDGASNFRIFIQIVVPLSKPIIAVMTLYAIVGYWNAYFNSLLYLTDDSLFPLQRVLQTMLIANDSGQIGGGVGNVESELLAETLKYATIIVSTAPILLLYPFFQRFFEKGLMVGGLKG